MGKGCRTGLRLGGRGHDNNASSNDFEHVPQCGIHIYQYL